MRSSTGGVVVVVGGTVVSPGVVVPVGLVVVVVLVLLATGGSVGSTGRKRSSAVLPTSALRLGAVLHAGQVDDDVVALAR